ncbi:hypothetical protein BDV40DRAFT_261086, partial [Aspergillus tamarii]
MLLAMILPSSPRSLMEHYQSHILIPVYLRNLCLTFDVIGSYIPWTLIAYIVSMKMIFNFQRIAPLPGNLCI